MTNYIIEKLTSLISSFSFTNETNTLNNNKKLNIDKIVEGYETDIELENDVFKDEQDEQDEIIFSIRHYISNIKNKFINYYNNENNEEDFEKVMKGMENIVL
jgi:ATP phosphoribosyltransferase